MLKNIIFDMGNVLIHWRADSIMDSMGIKDAEERNTLKRKVFNSLEWPLLDWGIIKEKEAEEIFCSRTPKEYHSHIHHALYWFDMLSPMENMDKLLKELKDKDYKLFVLSNTSTLMREHFSLIPGSEYFDGLVFSAEEKLVKPMPEIYSLLLSRYNLKAEESLFVDDLPINCSASEVMGMRGFVFNEDVEELREYIKSLE